MSIEAFDIKLLDGDLDFTTGDLAIEESSIEHLSAIMNSVTNDYKQDPQIGVNLQLFLNGPLNSSTIELKRIISDNMRRDGFRVDELRVSGDLSKNQLDIKTSGERIR